jgi:hypothetical protein
MERAMFKPQFNIGSKNEKKQMVIAGIGFAVVAGVFGYGLGNITPSIVFSCLSLVSLCGFLFYSYIGRDVFLILAAVGSIIGRVVSWFVVLLVYALVIGLLGSVLRLMGMNLLRRDFQACSQSKTMFVDAPHTDSESFSRQS